MRTILIIILSIVLNKVNSQNCLAIWDWNLRLIDIKYDIDSLSVTDPNLYKNYIDRDTSGSIDKVYGMSTFKPLNLLVYYGSSTETIANYQFPYNPLERTSFILNDSMNNSREGIVDTTAIRTFSKLDKIEVKSLGITGLAGVFAGK